LKTLITGGAGFIGSHLAERYLADGWSVAVIDDLSTGSFQNIAHLTSHPKFENAIDTVFNAPVVEELIDGCDLVFHLAAAVGVRLVVENPAQTIETNVHGTEVVLRAAARRRRRVVIASTSEVYGKSSKVPFYENDDLVIGPPNKGRWSYACSKALDEFLGLAYFREKGVPVTITRLFNTVGPRQTRRYGMVLPNFEDKAIRNEPIPVHGDGKQQRCFGYVLDVVEALTRIARTNSSVGEVVNIGNDEEVSIAELASLVRNRLNSKSEIVRIPYEEVYGVGFEDMPRRVPSLEKLERLIGYRPTTPLASIIDEIAHHARSALTVRADPEIAFLPR